MGRHFKCLVLSLSLSGMLLARASASPAEQLYIANPGWCPGVPVVPVIGDIREEHGAWHPGPPGADKHFVEYHRELLAQFDDYRIYGADPAWPGPCPAASPDVDPDPAITSVVAQPGSLLRSPHCDLNGFMRPANQDITVTPTVTAWPTRPVNMRLRNAAFHGFSAAAFSETIEAGFHNAGHGAIATHDRVGFLTGDMGAPSSAPRDGAFFQWHKNIDNIYADWAVGQYQLVGNTGTPIFFSVNAAALGAAGSSLAERNMADTYNRLAPAADDFGADPRIASDIYVGDVGGLNLVYAAGVREWEAVAAPPHDAWDVDAWTILNPPGSGWYFSVAPGGADPAGNVYESGGGGAKALFRAAAVLGLAAADNLDAVEVDQQKRVQGTNDSALVGIAERPRQWFSLSAASLATAPVMAIPCAGGAAVAVGPCDILQFNADGNLCIAVSAAALGLGAAGNELDALVIVDDGPTPNALDTADNIYFSLAPGSPSLAAGPYTAGDVLCDTAAGPACGALGGADGRLEITAAALAIAGQDMDALDVRLAANPNGACCRALGPCQDNVPPGACVGADMFWGPGTHCSAAECPSAPGACCLPRRYCVGVPDPFRVCTTNADCTPGTCGQNCVQVSDRACADARGNFQGVGIPCGSVNCPTAPRNDDCYGAYELPYDYGTYYQPPEEYRDNTYATSYGGYEPPSPEYSYDPPYTCYDHMRFSSDYGSGTIWYYYDVPAPRGGDPYRPIYITTQDPYAEYGDTRLAVYYVPPGQPNECDYLYQNYQMAEVACSDNYYAPEPYEDEYGYMPYYEPYGYVEYTPTQPGRYYVQVSSVYDANRTALNFTVRDPNIPAVSEWGLVALTLLTFIAGTVVLKRRVPT